MWNRRWIFVATLFACVWLAWHVSTPLAAQPKADAPRAGGDDKAADKPADQPRDEAALERELDVRYAKAYVTLVEATLAKYRDVNRRAPNTIRRGVMDALEETVREARDRVSLADSDDSRDSEIYVSSAESQMRAAQESLRKAEAANLQNSGTVPQTEIVRLKADLELAGIRVEKARHLASESPLSNVRFELEQLREDVQELRLIVALLRDRN